MSSPPTFSLTKTLTTRVFPESTNQKPTTISLSIIDATVSRYARCAAIWYHNPPSTPTHFLTPSHFHFALSQTLTSYPQWCGRAFYTPYQPNTKHTQRYRRVQITCNTISDPGVEFVAATSPKKLADYIPDALARGKVWDAACVPSKELYPSTSLSLGDDRSAVNPPNVSVQLTSFACGSTAVAISFTHALADAQTLSRFARDLAAVSRAMLRGEEPPVLSPIFDPGLLDERAVGDVDADEPDRELQEEARKLPMHRYDNYLEVEGQPFPYNMPGDFKKVAHLPTTPSTPIPWHEWDVKAKCSHRILHFTADEISNIYNLAAESQDVKLSKLDTLLAHIWLRINTARQLPPETTTYLDYSVGLRSRVEPPLPASFLGSPITQAAVEITIPSSPTSKPFAQLPEYAKQIRSTVRKFTPSAIGALLHDSAFEVSPQRLWRGFLGTRHIILTTWLHLGLEEVDFIGAENGGGGLRHVDPIMPVCDGLMEMHESIGDEIKNGHWSRNGVDVNVYLETETMSRLLEDPWLWGDQKSSN
ncbi:transferase family protein [Glarea lozoyensis ATCC 20868]|uniref:Transferase family protein n=1 Tax=Glarea lozoyensis (strain ATCC 20868 / MF5171) TaxID=1116229 RepID=S3DM33_GLAL2|nr:transferase family protein [Glarea lozoyensis ATCC 20868]EPE27588.1 transferase family protein [Glarea lozoyensis ATCC 20868]